MPEILTTQEETVDGIVYIITVYKDGRIYRKVKEGFENAVTNTEQAQLDLQMNVQYLVDLSEISMEEM